MAVSTNEDFSAVSTLRSFKHPALAANTLSQVHCDVTGNGQRFVLIETAEGKSPPMDVVENWYEESRDREQG